MTTKSFFAKCLRNSSFHRYCHTPSLVLRIYDFDTISKADSFCLEFRSCFPNYYCLRSSSIVSFIVRK